MTVDFHDENYDSDIDKKITITSSGASSNSIAIEIQSIGPGPSDSGKHLGIVLRKAEALLFAQAIRTYFEHIDS